MRIIFKFRSSFQGVHDYDCYTGADSFVISHTGSVESCPPIQPRHSFHAITPAIQEAWEKFCAAKQAEFAKWLEARRLRTP